MGDTTGIGWTHWPGTIGGTQNFWQGCVKKSEGCDNCYMYREKIRYGKDPAIVVRSAAPTFLAPLKLKEPHTLFVSSWTDFNNPEADDWRAEAWDVMRAAPWHRYLILTKLPGRFAKCLPPDWGAGWPNVVLMTSAENQRWADIRIPQLLKVPAVCRGISAEPLLGPIIFQGNDGPLSSRFFLRGNSGDQRIDWVITGGESDDSDPRPCDPDWVRGIRDQCLAAGVAYHHKQNGGKTRIDGVWGGKLVDGVAWEQFPEVPPLVPMPALDVLRKLKPQRLPLTLDSLVS